MKEEFIENQSNELYKYSLFLLKVHAVQNYDNDILEELTVPSNPKSIVS